MTDPDLVYIEDGVKIGRDTELLPNTRLLGTTVIGEGCVIKPGARITNSVIGPGVQIEEKAIVEDSVLWAHSRISTAAEIRGSIIGRSCHIGRNAVVDQGSVLGDKSTLTDYTRV